MKAYQSQILTIPGTYKHRRLEGREKAEMNEQEMLSRIIGLWLENFKLSETNINYYYILILESMQDKQPSIEHRANWKREGMNHINSLNDFYQTRFSMS